MREILFRGKRVIDGKWVESCCPLGEMHSGTVTYDFVSETVCQYTGLTDKNGRKIFEGDILRFENCSNYPVFCDSDYCAFGSCWYSDFDHLSKYRNVEIEVVGNIFDNPELLEDEG